MGTKKVGVQLRTGKSSEISSQLSEIFFFTNSYFMDCTDVVRNLTDGSAGESGIDRADSTVFILLTEETFRF